MQKRLIALLLLAEAYCNVTALMLEVAHRSLVLRASRSVLKVLRQLRRVVELRKAGKLAPARTGKSKQRPTRNRSHLWHSSIGCTFQNLRLPRA